MLGRSYALPTALILATSLLLVTASAGNVDAPEIEDGAGDHVLAPGGVETVVELGPPVDNFLATDLRKAWIASETDTSFDIHIQVTGTVATTTAATYHYEASISIGGTTYVATGTSSSSGASPGGVASSAVADGSNLVLTIQRADVGDPARGDSLSDFFVTAGGFLAQAYDSAQVQLTADRAPDSGGATYTFTAGPAGATEEPEEPEEGPSEDSDGDGLNDTWEQQHFGSLDEDGDGDPDGDGLTNAEEEAAGTDPNNADTDGDGHSDGDEVATGTDPLDPLDPAPEDDGEGTNSTEGAGSPQGDGPSTDPLAANETTDDAPAGAAKSGPLESLQDNAGYLGISGAGLLAVMTLSLVGLLARWKP